MIDLNRVVLVGHVVRDPKSRTLPSGEFVARFSVATNYARRSKAGTPPERGVDFHEVIAWRDLAHLVMDRLLGGHLVYVEGKLRHREYVNRLGVKVRTSEIVLSRVMLGRPPKNRLPQAAVDNESQAASQ